MAKKAINLTVPERRLKMADGTMWLFRADHRAWYTLEKHTGQPLMTYMDGLNEQMPLGKLYDIAWAMSATGRAKDQADVNFEDFLDLLPPMSGLQGWMTSLMELLAEAFPAAEGDPGNAQNPQEAAST